MDFSIIVPTFERPHRLHACLQALAQLDYPATQFEVIVVDDGGRTPLDPIVDRFQAVLGLRLLRVGHAGPAAARNAGASEAHAPTLAFLDDDCTPAPDWLRRLAEGRERFPGHLLGGRTVNSLTDQSCATASQVLVDYLYEYFNPDPDGASFLVSCNLAVPADAYRQLGGFDQDFPLAAAEDRDLCDRWRSRGWRMAYLSSAVVFHSHALSLASFWRQHVGYGRGASRFYDARRRRGRTGVPMEPLRFYARLVAHPFARHTHHPVRVSALLALSQVANVVGFLSERLSPQATSPGRAP